MQDQEKISATACATGENGHCVTCSDEVLTALAVRLDFDSGTALVEIEGQPAEVDISLLDQAEPGDRLLVHGGVVIGKL